jgi:hypothetical protein
MTTDQILALARKHLGGDMETSARLCLHDAVNLKNKGDMTYCRKRALDSLRFSIGILHQDYIKASK